MTHTLLGPKDTVRFWLALVGLAGASACAEDVGVLKSRADDSNGAGGSTATAPDAGAATGSAGAATGTAGGVASVDLYIMLDQSSSLGDPLPGVSPSMTWWNATTSAIQSVVQSPTLAGAGIGLQFFPLNGIAPASCSANYSSPEVEIGALPANAPALTQAIAAHSPNAFTPTAPALQGAIDHMKAWAPAHPGRVPVVVLVTDGFPSECAPQHLDLIAAIAAGGFRAEPSIRTFVVGLNLGPGAANLDAIANAGGSDHAIAIDDNVAATLAGALTDIVSQAGEGM